MAVHVAVWPAGAAGVVGVVGSIGVVSGTVAADIAATIASTGDGVGHPPATRLVHSTAAIHRRGPDAAA